MSCYRHTETVEGCEKCEITDAGEAVPSNVLFADFALAYDMLERIAANDKGVVGALANDRLKPLRERWEWEPGIMPNARAKESANAAGEPQKENTYE